MGIRLYPVTRDRSKLEVLAGVPAGTYDRLDALKDRHTAEESVKRAQGTWSDYDDGYRHYCETREDADLGTLDAFLTFGWGKFRDCGLATGCSGRLDDLIHCLVVLRHNGIHVDVALTEGLCWS